MPEAIHNLGAALPPQWPCIVVAGPTATGKTALAANLAHALGSEIFSMDSRQVYRGLDLGTGKDREEYLRFDPPIPSHLIDIVEPEEVYSLFRFQSDCYAALEDFRSRRGSDLPPVLAGGTGLYLEAVLKRYDIAGVPEDVELREALNMRSAPDLERELLAADPALYARTDRSSKKRLVRAVEIARLSAGGPVARSRLPDWAFNPLVFITAWPRDLLRHRIEERLDARLRAGLVEEVRGLRARGLSWERLDLFGMEYRQIATYLRGEKTHDLMVMDLLQEIHRLAKRQETWFRGFERRGLKVEWIGPEATAADLLARYTVWKRA